MDWTKVAFDFEAMATLVKADPIGFAVVREELIQQLIGQSAHAQKLASLQMELDAVRYGVSPRVQSGGECSHGRRNALCQMAGSVGRVRR